MPSKKKEIPTIELYMYSLNQEFPAGKGHETYLKRYSDLQKDIDGKLVLKAALETQVFKTQADDALAVPAWSAQWLENRWIENHTKAAGVGIRELLDDTFRSAILRREDFGAILFEPRSDRVYRLNRTGAELYEKLRDLALAGKLSNLSVPGFERQDVEPFVSSMKAAGLWGQRDV